MKNNFTLRIYQDTMCSVVLSSFNSIVISDIEIISKPSKFNDICFHKANQRKHAYSIEISKPFNPVSGSHSTPTLTFKGEYIDIIVKDFPRYPAFYQDKYAARSCQQGFGYTNYMNKGFPTWLEYRTTEIII